jgi:hypothetical protein
MQKTAKIAAIGAASVFAVVALVLAYPAMAFTNNGIPVLASREAAGSATTASKVIPTPTALTAGQTLTFTSTNGHWRAVGPGAANDSVKSGSASGTEVLTVTGAFRGGYALAITSGSISINGTTYDIASGTTELGPHQAHLVGQGSLSATTPGSFLEAANAHANFRGMTSNTLRFDVQVNGQEYAVTLLVNATYS